MKNLEKHMNRFKAAIFDLDHCIVDTRLQLGPRFLDPVLDTARHIGLEEDDMATLSVAMWTVGFADTVQAMSIDDEHKRLIIASFKNLRAPPDMKTYGDERFIKELPLDCRRFLVTTGYREFQNSKIDSLGIANLFEETLIDDIDLPTRQGKKGVFADIVARHRLDPREVIVIGDNPNSELAAGKALGMTTVQTLRPGIERGEANHHIAGFAELHKFF